ncbi:MAG: hypothetical protein PHV16_02700, partial [Candidatus Nanoarchaeia archaeon]|nr:hypothetical protein [Candidatus Nanoarchaeia archaeon]
VKKKISLSCLQMDSMKNNLNKTSKRLFFALLIILLVTIISKNIFSQVSAEFESGLEEMGAIYDHETSTMEVSNVEDEIFGKDYLFENNVENIKSKDGSVIRVGEGIESIEVKDGIAKIVFSDTGKSNTLSFEKDGKEYEISAEKGVVELTENGIILQEGMSFKTDDGKSLLILKDETKIKIEGEKIRVSGDVSINYDDKIKYELILSGAESQIQLIQNDKEKLIFRHSDDPGEIFVNIGFYHNSEECEGKNCISYKEERDENTETQEIKYYTKLKMDGSAIIAKEYDNKLAYTMYFGDEKFLISKDGLSEIDKLEFSKKMIVNYNDGYATINVLESGKENNIIEVISKDNNNIYFKGNLIISDDLVLDIVERLKTYFGEENIKEIIKEAQDKQIFIEQENTNLYSFVDENLILSHDEVDTIIMLALIKQEVTNDIENNQPTQSTAIAFHQVFIENPEKYKGYTDKNGNLMISINDNLFWDEKGNRISKENIDLNDYNLVSEDGKMIDEKSDNELLVEKSKLSNMLKNNPSLDLNVGADYLSYCLWSQERIKERYDYDGNKWDIAFLRYNLGYTAADDVLISFASKGGGGYEDLQNFLKMDNDVSEILKKHYEIGYIPEKIEIITNYMANMREYLGYV